MTTLLFKKSLNDSETIEIRCFTWMSCKDGIMAKTINGWELISTKEIYFWGVK